MIAFHKSFLIGIIVSLVVSVVEARAENFPISQQEWISQFQKRFANEFCGFEKWRKLCLKISVSECTDYINETRIKKCAERGKISFPMQNYASSLDAGDRVGRCLAQSIRKTFPISKKDQSECYRLERSQAF